MRLTPEGVQPSASAYLFSKLLLLEMGPFTLMGERFLIAFALLSLIFWKRYRALDKRTVIAGLVMGPSFFATMAFELHALAYAPSTSVSFLENTAIAIVPLAEAVLILAAIIVSSRQKANDGDTSHVVKSISRKNVAPQRVL